MDRSVKKGESRFPCAFKSQPIIISWACAQIEISSGHTQNPRRSVREPIAIIQFRGHKNSLIPEPSHVPLQIGGAYANSIHPVLDSFLTCHTKPALHKANLRTLNTKPAVSSFQGNNLGHQVEGKHATYDSNLKQNQPATAHFEPNRRPHPNIILRVMCNKNTAHKRSSR